MPYTVTLTVTNDGTLPFTGVAYVRGEKDASNLPLVPYVHAKTARTCPYVHNMRSILSMWQFDYPLSTGTTVISAEPPETDRSPANRLRWAGVSLAPGETFVATVCTTSHDRPPLLICSR